MIKLKCKYKFLQEVTNILDGTDIMVVTFIQIAADGGYLYGCLCKSGETKWFKEYELLPVINSRSTGFSLVVD